MTFNSLDFLLFLPLVVVAFFALPQRWRWVLLLAASYFFYGCWKPEYLLLIVTSTLIDYWAGLKMGGKATQAQRRPYLWASLIGNLGMLFTFKYAAFANSNLHQLFEALRLDYPIPLFELLLPVGISFYVFQSLSYTIDVYKGRCPPERHLGIFALYVSFFPQLVAGPIERSTHLLPQFRQPHPFVWDHLRTGVLLILWGFFLKGVIADRVAIYIDHVYSHPGDFTAVPLVFATFLFVYQMLCDFADYSLVAIGSARIMGYTLSPNFNRPFAARTLAEFWNRWHMTLTSWIRDYCYKPLARLTRNRFEHYLVLNFVWVLFGLWHGASWNFILYGLYAGVAMMVGHATAGVRGRWIARLTPPGAVWRAKLHRAGQALTILAFAFWAGVPFRSGSLEAAGVVLRGMAGDWSLTSAMLRAPGFNTWELLLALAPSGCSRGCSGCKNTGRPG